MNFKTKIKSLIAASALCLMATPSFATIVVFETSQGDIEVNLFDNATPKTVANFLTYVNDASYNTTVIHRSVPGFIVQGGGFTFDGDNLQAIEDNGTVVNEPLYSNVTGTIAMAKIGGDPDSATSQWFFNLDDNSANLDAQNGGFTVFGQVISGMEVLETIEALTHCGETVLVDFTPTQCSDDSVIAFENLVSITNVDITDATVDTASTLTPVLADTSDNVSTPSTSSSSGGTVGLISLFAAIAVVWRRNKRSANFIG